MPSSPARASSPPRPSLRALGGPSRETLEQGFDPVLDVVVAQHQRAERRLAALGPLDARVQARETLDREALQSGSGLSGSELSSYLNDLRRQSRLTPALLLRIEDLPQRYRRHFLSGI